MTNKNVLADDEWTRQCRLRNEGTRQEKIYARKWLIAYAEKYIHKSDTTKKKDEHEKT